MNGENMVATSSSAAALETAQEEGQDTEQAKEKVAAALEKEGTQLVN